MILFAAAGENIKVYNLSAFTFESLKAQDPGQLHDNLIDYITKFSGNVRDIFLDKFLFTEQLKRLNEGGILWQVFDRFTQIDLHPERVGNIEMGYLFEDLIRRFSEISNETAGEHFTPREVIRLIVELLIANDDTKLTGKGIIRQVYDPACGTGGMLALTEQALKEFNPSIRVELFGQELNGESFGICKSDMLVTGHDPEQIAFGNTLTNDAHRGKSFHYMLSNPPYGVDWKKYQDPIREEAQTLGTEGRFGAGLPRISDGQLLFLQHMISKMRDDETGSRIGIVMNGSPLFTGGANSGESEIRRWMLENDWVEAIVALPTDLFYNTGIQTYVWLLTNRKPAARRGKVQLIDASGETVLEIHAQVPRLQAPGNPRGGAQGDHPYLCRHVERQRRVRGILQDLRHHRLRLPGGPRRAALAAELPSGTGAYRTPEGGEGLPEAGRERANGDPGNSGLAAPEPGLHQSGAIRQGAGRGAQGRRHQDWRAGQEGDLDGALRTG